MTNIVEQHSQAIYFSINFKEQLRNEVVDRVKEYFKGRRLNFSSYGFSIDGFNLTIGITSNFHIYLWINTNTFQVDINNIDYLDIGLEAIDKAITKLLEKKGILIQGKTDEII